MDSQDFTREQCEAIQAKIGEQRDYFNRLVARMDANDFPQADPVRRDVAAVQDTLQALAMNLHYLTCVGKVGHGSKRRG